MRISDWSSDVCSSDLPVHAGQLEFVLEVRHRAQPAQQDSTTDFRDEMRQQRIETANLDVAVVRQRVAGQVHAQLQLQRRALGRALGHADDQAIEQGRCAIDQVDVAAGDRIEGAGIRSEEQTSELQSLMRISYAVFCLKKKK